jgi:hypothetical protein
VNPDEAIALYGREALSDPKPEPRIRDKDVLRKFHETKPECLCCGNSHAHAHHLISRGQGGDDVLENLIPLCELCHTALHDSRLVRGDFGRVVTPGIVQDAIGSFLSHEAGDDHRAYVYRKLGQEAGALWMEQRFGVEL